MRLIVEHVQMNFYWIKKNKFSSGKKSHSWLLVLIDIKLLALASCTASKGYQFLRHQFVMSLFVVEIIRWNNVKE